MGPCDSRQSSALTWSAVILLPIDLTLQRQKRAPRKWLELAGYDGFNGGVQACGLL